MSLRALLQFCREGRKPAGAYLSLAGQPENEVLRTLSCCSDQELTALIAGAQDFISAARGTLDGRIGLNVNEWADRCRSYFIDVEFRTSNGDADYGIAHVTALAQGARVAQWFEAGSYWVGDHDPAKPDIVGYSAPYSVVGDLS